MYFPRLLYSRHVVLVIVSHRQVANWDVSFYTRDYLILISGYFESWVVVSLIINSKNSLKFNCLAFFIIFNRVLDTEGTVCTTIGRCVLQEAVNAKIRLQLGFLGVCFFISVTGSCFERPATDVGESVVKSHIVSYFILGCPEFGIRLSVVVKRLA